MFFLCKRECILHSEDILLLFMYRNLLIPPPPHIVSAVGGWWGGGISKSYVYKQYSLRCDGELEP